MEAKVIKPFRWDPRVFDIGEIGEVVGVSEPFVFKGKPIYDFYVEFPNSHPVGVLKEWVELVTD